ncbi:MAG: Cysteine desulfurase SufS [Chroococcopsis gigantea SAG 12.99]|nr:aminotransferase class V-fold PLP-dependent enzyme [Chlorogloea purpurea SAG 13.99]MDV2999036.1 Cysteine desulfurase SufS [Chroococcopsis gigantea SAG 12.99]
MLDKDSITANLQEQRLEFPGLTNKNYFNFGGQGTLPKAGLEAIVDAHNYLQQQGPFSGKVNSWIAKRSDLLRQEIAAELGVRSTTITITEDVTVGCNIALWGLDWQPGDHILLTDGEHPGIIAAVKELARRFQLEVSTCKLRETLNGGDPLAVIKSSLQPRTRLLVASHVLWNTGQVLPLEEISKYCHDNPITENPVLVLVDAAQSVGCLDLNLQELQVDFYAFTGHKWWCGPAGVGGLYVRPEVLESLHPTFIGWRGLEVDSQGYGIGWKPDGRRYEVATSAYPLYEGLRAAIAVHHQWGSPRRRYEQILELTGYLWQELRAIDSIICLKNTPPESGLVSFLVNGSLTPQKLVTALENQGFFLRTLLDPLCIRACVHYFTVPSEIEKLVQALKELI